MNRTLIKKPLQALRIVTQGPGGMVVAVLAAFAGGALIIALIGISPFDAYAALIQSAFGSRNAIGETLVKACPLLLAGLGTAIAFRGGVFSIGAEGQIYMGAIGAGIVGIEIGVMSPIVGIPLTLLMGALLGAIWGGIVGYLIIRFRINAVIVSLMFNSIAIELAKHLMVGPWQDPRSSQAYTAEVTVGTRLPILLPGTRLHSGIVVALLATILIWWVIQRTVFGYRVKVMGENKDAAISSGINTGRMIVAVMLISGALSGLAGVGEVAGIQHRLLGRLSPGYGYTAVAITQLGKRDPLGVLISSILFAALLVGARGMQRISGVPVEVVTIIEGLVLVFLMASEGLRFIKKMI